MARPGALFSIGPQAPFLPTLAGALLDGTLFPDWPRSGPFWLSDITIFLPTRRARSALAAALADALGAQPLLLPDIRALGGEDPTAEPFLPPYQDAALPAPIAPLRRRLLLAQLVEKWLETRDDAPFCAPGASGPAARPNSAEVLALADSLAALIDDFTIAGLDFTALGAIEDAQLPAQWQDNLAFVDFVFRLWPAVLAQEGEMDAAARTNALLARQETALATLYGQRPVLVAGSTGSIPATARLIAAIARLPRGAVVLPGVDTALNQDQVEALRAVRGNPHGHNQYGLMRLLRTLGTPPEAVTELAPAATPRTAILRGALAMAEETAGWPLAIAALGQEALEAGTQGISLIRARTAEEEARAVALAARQALDGGKSVAIITADQTLARRISAELKRFEVDVDDAAGTPLLRSRAGRLVQQIVTLLTQELQPVDLIALLRNRHVSLGLGRAAVAQATDWLDFALLRGQRPLPGFSGLRAGVDKNLAGDSHYPALRLDAGRAAAVRALIDALEEALAPLATVFAGPAFSAAQFAQALAVALERIRALPDAHAPIALDGADGLERWCAMLATQGGRGPRFSPSALALALGGLMGGQSVRPRRPAPPDIAIFGRLEARLMSADTVMLAGLVEGVWPEVADPGPWMSRGMRLAAGLEPPEKLHGLAAHDFLMAAGATTVILSLAERAGTAPATPSRLVQRLEAFVGEALSSAMAARGAVWIDEARALDLAGHAPRPEARPSPRPPAEKRPRGLSITEAETLLRSPYDLYAKYVLGLRPIAALGTDPDRAERGTIVHDIFGDYIAAGHDPLAPDAMATLEGLARDRFAGLEAIPERRDIWLERFLRAAQAFVAFERGRAPDVWARGAERDGRWTFETGGEPFTLRGRADRIDTMRSGGLDIIDFKTGSIPSAADMKGCFAPQLPLEAMMARHGAFEAIPQAESEALSYIKIGNGPEAFVPTAYALEKGVTLDAAIDTVFAHFQRHVQQLLLSDALPLAARVFPKPRQAYRGNYDHLARTDEWTVLEAGSEEE